jgi:hypothetical protein
MAAPFSVCTNQEQRSVTRFLWSKCVSGAEIHRILSAQYGNSVLLQRGVYTNGEKNSKTVAQFLCTKKEPDARPCPQPTTKLSAFVT